MPGQIKELNNQEGGALRVYGGRFIWIDVVFGTRTDERVQVFM